MGSRLGYPSRQTIVVEPIKKPEDPVTFQAHFDEISVEAETVTEAVTETITSEKKEEPVEEGPSATTTDASVHPLAPEEEKKEETHKKKRHRRHKK